MINYQIPWKFLIIGCFINFCSSTQRPIVDQCSKWNASAKVVIYEPANITTDNISYSLNLTNSSLGINRVTGEIAVLDDNNHRVILFNQSNLTVIIAILSSSSNLTNTSSLQYSSPSAIGYDSNNSIYIVDRYEQQIIKIYNPIEYGENTTLVVNWNVSTANSTLNFTALGLCIDNTNQNVLISDYDNHRVIVYQQNSSSGTTYAGNGTAGNSSSQLKNPTSIVMHDNGTLFVNDVGNNRIQMFERNSKNGTTLPININGYIIGLSLYMSEILVMNTKTAVYLFDLTNNVRTCAIGCNDSELNNTHNALIDNDGNLIVTDSNLVLLYPIYEQCPTVSAPFVVNNTCSNGTFGVNCSSSENICVASQPCVNGTCVLNGTSQFGYSCECQWGFYGPNCQIDRRPCQPFTCFARGNCSNTTIDQFVCHCDHGYEGTNCQLKVNFCGNVTCQNRGVCFPQFLNFTCFCLTGFSGRLCEIPDTSMAIRGYVAKSFGYVAILMLCILIGFIVILDVLKYGFGIDPVKTDRDALRKRNMKKIKKKVTPTGPKVAYRFQYVN